MPFYYRFLIALSILSSFVFADSTPVLQRTGMQFDSSIPTIQSVLGYDFGERITRHRDMETYFNALLKAAPDRVKVQKIGESIEGRALYYIIVSAPENMTRLDELRQANLKLSEPRKTSAGEADAIIQNNPVFVCLSYSVHGNEHSSTEAAMATAYYLLAARDPNVAQIMKNCVIIIDPLQNPDGRERFVNYFNSTVGNKPNTDPNAAEHNEVWPGGRYNHYLFDMNRDWTVLTQPETYARIQAYQQYQPEGFIDFHEMGRNNTYFFPPTSTPHNPNVPKSLPAWWQKLGKAIAADFDKNNVEYYTAEHYDFWYPGYGDSWPTYNGAIAGTYEQASARGLQVMRKDGTLLDYKDAVWHHFLSSLATCKMSSENRQAKLKDFYDFRASAVQEGKTGPVKEYVISRTNDPLETDILIRKLLTQGIEVRQASADFKASVRNYYTDQTETKSFHAGDYIIPMDQPLKRLIEVTFEKEQQFDKDFLAAEAKRREEGEETELYDITAWALPLAYGLDIYWSADVFSSNAPAVTQLPIQSPELQPASYAYLVDYRSNEDVHAIVELLNRDVRIYYSGKPFTMNGHPFHAGSFIIKTKGNVQNLESVLKEVSNKTGEEFIPTSTGWTEEGPDIGSSDVSFLEKPKVAVVMNLPTDPTSVGAIEYLFDQRYSLNFTPIEGYELSDMDLKDYNVIILPDGGDWASYDQIIGDDGIKKLDQWVRSGGTLIALQRASTFLIDNGKLTSVKRIKSYIKDSVDPAPQKDEKKDDSNAKPTEAPDYLLGSIARIKINQKHFLGFGYSTDELAVFVNSSNVFTPPPDMKAVGAYADADRLKIAGLFWDITKKRLEKKAYLTDESMGKGHVILFAEDPNFRAYWEGLSKLFLNGVIYGPSE